MDIGRSGKATGASEVQTQLGEGAARPTFAADDQPAGDSEPDEICSTPGAAPGNVYSCLKWRHWQLENAGICLQRGVLGAIPGRSEAGQFAPVGGNTSAGVYIAPESWYGHGLTWPSLGSGLITSVIIHIK